MKKINFAIELGSNMTSIYKAGVGVVLHDRSVVVTGIKGKHEVAVAVGHDAYTSGMEYRKVVDNLFILLVLKFHGHMLVV